MIEDRVASLPLSPLAQKMHSFFKKCGFSNSLSGPFLLGYSGGPDSKALLYLLLECQKKIGFELCLAHVDHGWREESAREAKEIASEAADLKLRCFFHKVEHCATKNMEAEGRRERLAFFQEVYKKIGAEALLLAHQADDQAETILKRVLEGSHPINWSGIAGDAQIEGMRVLRPLLGVSKKELLDWLQEGKRIPFEDPTNSDPRFLRGRMRGQILPTLSNLFGKEVSVNLCKMGSIASEMDAYLKKKCARHWENWHCLEGRIEWDLSEVQESLELRWLLKMWAQKLGVHVSYDTLQLLIDGLQNKVAGKRFPLKGGEVRLNGGHFEFVFI